MDQGQSLFHDRLRRLGEKHRALARGSRAQMRPDGLIVLTPKRGIQPPSPRPLATVLLIVLLYKAFLIASLGTAGYDERVTRLQAGTAVERTGAVLMQADSISATLARAMVIDVQ